MFNSNKFAANDRRMNKYEILQGLSYYKEADVIKNKSASCELLEKLPKPPSDQEKKKIAEALTILQESNLNETI